MDLQICSACNSPTPAGSSIKLKTCQHSFCVLCLKYALMYGGTPDLQCPYPLGTFECGTKPNENEVQYVLEYEEERQDLQQNQDEAAGENGKNNEATGELEKLLDRVLSVDVDEFPGEPTEHLPSVKQLNLNGLDDCKDEFSVDSNEVNSALDNGEELLPSGSDQLLGSDSEVVSNDETKLTSDCGSDMLQAAVSNDVENEQDNSKENESIESTSVDVPSPCEKTDETLNASVESKCDPNIIEMPIQSHSEQESAETDELQTSNLDIGNDSGEAESSSSMDPAKPVTIETEDESSTVVKDVSNGAVPKERTSTGQCNVENLNCNDSSNAVNSSEDQDLTLALKLQEEESKIDMDLLLAISDANLPPNMESFECPVCYGQFKPYEGVTLTFCFHSFCKPCLAESVKHSDELEVTCPALVDGLVKCNAIVQDGAIRDLLSEEDFGRFQDRCLQTAEAVIPNTVHCLTPNCRGWVELIGEVEYFDCTICSVSNCVLCKAIHEDQSCEDYQENIQRKDDEIKSEARLRTMVETREGMRCPKCGVMITKIAGCDFMTCTTCKTGICWPTRGPRWGPAGQGDISGGCRCKVDNGRRCHPECEGCH